MLPAATSVRRHARTTPGPVRSPERPGKRALSPPGTYTTIGSSTPCTRKPPVRFCTTSRSVLTTTSSAPAMSAITPLYGRSATARGYPPRLSQDAHRLRPGDRLVAPSTQHRCLTSEIQGCLTFRVVDWGGTSTTVNPSRCRGPEEIDVLARTCRGRSIGDHGLSRYLLEFGVGPP